MWIGHKEVFELLDHVPLFVNLDESDLNRLSGLFQAEVYRDGEIVFDYGDASEALYIIFDGHVNLRNEKQGEENAFACLGTGDVFGEEALLFDDPRYYKSVADGETIVLRLDVENYIYIQDDLIGFEEILEVSIRSRHLSTKIKLPWLQQDEFVHVMSRRHPAILWSRLATPAAFGLGMILFSALLQWRWLPGRPYGLIALGAGLVIAALWLLWTVIDWRNDTFIVTNKRVVWVEKVALVYESRQEAPLRTIMSVGIQRNRLGTLLGYADVVVQTYVGTIRLRDLAYSESIASLIESYWHRSESRNRREEAQVMSQKLSEKLDLPWDPDEATHEIAAQKFDEPTETEQKEPGFMTWLFSDFIRLRYESRGAIIYRKHWFVLLEKIWLQVLLMAAAIAGLVLRLGGLLAFLPLMPALAGLFVLMFIIFVWMVYQYADWRNDIFKVTLDQIIDIDRKPLGKIRRRSAPLENVLSIEYERLGFWGFVFNFGTVYISVGNLNLTFDHVYNPSEVQQDIFYRMGERLENLRQYEIQSERERVSEWIASYHRKTSKIPRTDDMTRGVDEV